MPPLLFGLESCTQVRKRRPTNTQCALQRWAKKAMFLPSSVEALQEKCSCLLPLVAFRDLRPGVEARKDYTSLRSLGDT
jgi:hypothetical protein